MGAPQDPDEDPGPGSGPYPGSEPPPATVANTPPTGVPPTSAAMNPKLWMGLAAALAVVAIALLIWGLGQRSDAKDANAKVAAAAAKEDRERGENAELEGFDREDSARMQALRAKLLKERKRAEQYGQQVTDEANAVQAAQDELAAAKTDAAKAAAQLRVAEAKRKAAVACAQATVNAIDAFDSDGNDGDDNDDGDGASPAAGRALDRLEAVADTCESVIDDD